MTKGYLSHGDDEWHTPRRYTDMATRVMGGIDTDPATTDKLARALEVLRWYTKERSGLGIMWVGRVWLNPPYSLAGDFVCTLSDSIDCGATTQAMVLVNNKTETKWYQALLGLSDAICLPSKRIAFEKEDGSRNQPTRGNTFFYVGENVRMFRRVFGEIGHVLQVYR